MSGYVGLWTLCLAVCIGCRAPETPYPAALNAESPNERIDAIKHAAQIDDRSVLSILVQRLADDDSAVRFFAIMALEKMTGQTMGYKYYEDSARRRQAIERWNHWLEKKSITTQPAVADL